MKQKRTFTADECHLIWEFYSRCNLSYWFELDEITDNFDKIIDKLHKTVPVQGVSSSKHRELFAGESFDLKWERLLNHLFIQRNLGLLPSGDLQPNISESHRKALSYVLDLAKQNAVPEYMPKFVNPASKPLYDKQQEAFSKVETLMLSEDIITDELDEVIF
jgi:hypothetical protein